jgi:N-acetyl-alpha-D-muramate 1-phosphate uridylyltransferase
MSKAVKQAMIFAAGLGSRLKPLTDTVPKVLVKVDGKEILADIIDKLLHQNFEKIVINTHYFAEKVEYFIKQKYPGKNILISREEVLLETGGGIIRAAKYFDKGPVLIHNGDILTDADLNILWKKHIESKSDASLLSFERESSRVFIWDKEDKLIGWKNQSTGETKWSIKKDEFEYGAFGAIHIIDTELIKLLGNERKFSITEGYLELAKSKKITRIKYNPSYWFDIGSHNKLNEAENYLSLKRKNQAGS